MYDVKAGIEFVLLMFITPGTITTYSAELMQGPPAFPGPRPKLSGFWYFTINLLKVLLPACTFFSLKKFFWTVRAARRAACGPPRRQVCLHGCCAARRGDPVAAPPAGAACKARHALPPAERLAGQPAARPGRLRALHSHKCSVHCTRCLAKNAMHCARAGWPGGRRSELWRGPTAVPRRSCTPPA